MTTYVESALLTAIFKQAEDEKSL